MCLKIYIHPFLYVLLFLFLFTGRIKSLFLFMFLIFVHELGHFFTAYILGWKTRQICLYPYGGISKFDTFVNVPIFEELLVLVMGPVIQIVGYFFLKSVISVRYQDILLDYHYFLLWFNLLPIYPLDGGRLLHLFCCKLFSYRNSFYFTICFSYLTVGVVSFFLFLDHSFLFLIVLLFCIFKIRKEYMNFPMVYQKFLLERYFYCWVFPKYKVISSIQKMKRDTYHYFKKQGKYIPEEKYLKRIFHDYKI